MTANERLEFLCKKLQQNGFKVFDKWRYDYFGDSRTEIYTILKKLVMYDGQDGVSFFRQVHKDTYEFRLYNTDSSTYAYILRCVNQKSGHDEVFLLVITRKGTYVSYNLWAEKYINKFLHACNRAFKTSMHEKYDIMGAYHDDNG